MPADPRACTCAPNAVSIECPVHGAATRAHLLDAMPRATPTAMTSTFEMGVQAGAREGYDRGVRDTLERLAVPGTIYALGLAMAERAGDGDAYRRGATWALDWREDARAACEALAAALSGDARERTERA